MTTTETPLPALGAASTMCDGDSHHQLCDEDIWWCEGRRTSVADGVLWAFMVEEVEPDSVQVVEPVDAEVVEPEPEPELPAAEIVDDVDPYLAPPAYDTPTAEPVVATVVESEPEPEPAQDDWEPPLLPGGVPLHSQFDVVVIAPEIDTSYEELDDEVDDYAAIEAEAALLLERLDADGVADEPISRVDVVPPAFETRKDRRAAKRAEREARRSGRKERRVDDVPDVPEVAAGYGVHADEDPAIAEFVASQDFVVTARDARPQQYGVWRPAPKAARTVPDAELDD